MADITLISGSTLGGAEYVAEHLAEKLEEAGFTTETLHGPLLEDLSASGIWLIISSTHGAGDIPDNLSPFYEALQEQKPDLSAVRLAQSVLVVVNMTPFVGLSINSRQNSKIPVQNRQAKH